MELRLLLRTPYFHLIEVEHMKIETTSRQSMPDFCDAIFHAQQCTSAGAMPACIEADGSFI